MHPRTLAVRAVTSVLLAVAVAVVAGQVLGHPVGLGYVTSDSMAPTLSAGDGFVAVPPALAGPVEEGDVVVFRAETLHGGGLVTHRVVGRTAGGYVTRGDANPLSDQSRRGEPPVSRDDVVAEALRVGGEVVVVPHLGAAVETARRALRTVRAAAAATTGLPWLRGTPGVGVLVVSLLGYAAAATVERLRGGRRGRDGPGSRGPGWPARPGRGRAAARRRSPPGTDPRRVVAVLALGLVVAATAAVVVPSGAHEFALQSAAGPSSRPDVVAPGATTDWNLTLRNGGLVPTVVFLEPSGPGVSVADRRLRVGPRNAATAAVTVRAPRRAGPFVRRVSTRRYPMVLPPAVLGALYAVHPWAPLLAVDALVALLFVAVTAPLVGRGRLRSRPDRPGPGLLSRGRRSE